MAADVKFTELFKAVPNNLVVKVNGDGTEQGFRHVGFHIAEGIENELPKTKGFLGSEKSILKQSKRILDFGSGLGRVILELVDRAPKAEITGFDIDPMMNRWAEHLLTGKKIKVVSSTLDLPDEHFDLITIVSVFTHLDKTTDFWLSEVHRLLSKNGFAFITYQDDTLFEEMKVKGAHPKNASIASGKYVVGAESAEGGAGMGTFYTTPHWKLVLEKYFNVEVLKPRGLFRHQSISIVTRKDVQIDRLGLYRTYMASLEQDIYDLRRKHEIAY